MAACSCWSASWSWPAPRVGKCCAPDQERAFSRSNAGRKRQEEGGGGKKKEEKKKRKKKKKKEELCSHTCIVL
jgi:hypothetical protein